MAEVTVYNYQAIEERRWLRSLVRDVVKTGASR